MSNKTSAGLLLFRRREASFEVLLVHPGGPFWKDKDWAAWSIPKGEFDDGEAPLDAARREFEEETGFTAAGPFVPLAPLAQKSGKIIHAWAAEGDLDASAIRSNTFSLEWPPRSGRKQEFPEVDRAAWFAPEEASRRIHPGQAPFLEELSRHLARGGR
jgi:predicted NUDIX family NTP pyrophosphohydrolase